MSLYRISSRFPRMTPFSRCWNSLLVHARQHHPLPILSSPFHSLCDSQSKVAISQVSLLHHSTLNTYAFQRFGFSSSASTETNEKENAQSGSEQGSAVENNGAAAKTTEDTEASRQIEASSTKQKEDLGSDSEPHVNKSQSVKRRRTVTKRTAFSDSDSEEELSMEDLVKLVAEKEELLKLKATEIAKMQDKVLRTLADMENVVDRTRRESDNVKKFAIQNFAKSLLDVADNLSRASSVVKDSFLKIDTSKDTAGAVPLLKTLLEGVEMTEKQLVEVFKKSGVEKYDPTNEQFDPNMHNAVFQVSDPSKTPGTIAVVLKAGYMLHDRVLRPAEVGVTEAVENKETEKGSEGNAVS